MAVYRSIPLISIDVPERLRLVEEDHALAIQASIVEHGLINPITVRPTGERFVLVAGAHRHRAMELLGEAEIDAVIVEADETDAVLLEITENLFRNELSVLDRAVFVMTYRDAWERKYGKIARGNPKLNNSVKLTELAPSPLDLIQQEAASGFSQHVAEKLGLSVSAVERAQYLGQNLHPDLRRSLRGRPEAENQSLLQRLARLESGVQQKVAAEYSAAADIKAILASIEAQPAPDPDKDYNALVAAWTRAGKKDRDRFLTFIRTPRQKLPKLSELLSEEAEG